MFQSYRDHIPEEERGDLIAAYYTRLTSKDRSV
jgi:proline iminopeptidase